MEPRSLGFIFLKMHPASKPARALARWPLESGLVSLGAMGPALGQACWGCGIFNCGHL